MDVLSLMSLLESKNRCLKRLLDLGERFISGLESRGGQFELAELDSFQDRRDSIIKTLSLYDKKISEVVGQLSREARTSDLIRQVELALAEKDGLIAQVLKADDRIIVAIEQEKNNALKGAAVSHKNLTTLQKFKSTWAAEARSGEGLDEKL